MNINPRKNVRNEDSNSSSSLGTVARHFVHQVFPDATVASPIARTLERNRTASQIPATPLFYFAERKQAENIKIRLSGQILVTLEQRQSCIR